MDDTDLALEEEYEIISRLAGKLWHLEKELQEVKEEIAKRSFYFHVASDGLVEVGLGVM